MADLLIRDEGTIVVLTPVTEAGREWVADNVCSEPWQWLGDSLGMDHRMAPDLIRGAQADGLEVSAE